MLLPRSPEPRYSSGAGDGPDEACLARTDEDRCKQVSRGPAACLVSQLRRRARVLPGAWPQQAGLRESAALWNHQERNPLGGQFGAVVSDSGSRDALEIDSPIYWGSSVFTDRILLPT